MGKVADAMISHRGRTREEALQSLVDEWLILKCCGRPEEVVGLVAFPASERTSFITGGAYYRDGGYSRSRF